MFSPAINNLIHNIKTHENLQALNEDLSEIILKLSGKLGDGAEVVVKKKSQKFGELLVKYLREEAGNGGVRSSLKAGEVLNSLKKELEKMSTLDLSVAVTPSESFIKAVFAWAQRNLGDGVVVNFKKNPLIVGGAIISYNGQYADFSVAKKLKQEFKQKP